MLPDLSARILDRWTSHFEAAKPVRIDYLSVTGTTEGGTTTFLAFPDRAAVPSFAVKLARDARAEPWLAREADAVDAVAACPPVVSRAVPAVCFLEHAGGRAALVQSIVPGHPMRIHFRPGGHVDFAAAETELRLVARWLATMNLATIATSPSARDTARARLAGLARRFCQVFDPTPREAGHVAAALGELDRLLAPGVVIQHGDFSRQNILLDGGIQEERRVGVIDWTCTERYGLLAHDLLFLLVSYFLQLRRRPGLAGFVDAFRGCVIESNRGSRIVADLLHEYGDQLGVSPGDLRALVLWFLVERAMFDHDAMASCAAKGIFPRWTLALAAESGAPAHAPEARQFWFALFREFVAAERSAVA